MRRVTATGASATQTASRGPPAPETGGRALAPRRPQVRLPERLGLSGHRRLLAFPVSWVSAMLRPATVLRIGGTRVTIYPNGSPRLMSVSSA
jgi:hypothetical protein